ncbi:unnamed protein product [Spirodela intermedia]|uniref:Uncharacterized protein n=2 Tax=Spirodela intermedia TaxID=51605 RepID=A0ABN7E913_SPIIN|nr:unnamed protein product [Spirodela intermedia]CAA7394141.1 unnamed protein product [Spirodela intermedia]
MSSCMSVGNKHPGLQIYYVH